MKGWKTIMYIGIMGNTGPVVDENEAFDYAMDNITRGELKEEFGDEIIDWFFSGNWIKEPEND